MRAALTVTKAVDHHSVEWSCFWLSSNVQTRGVFTLFVRYTQSISRFHIMKIIQETLIRGSQCINNSMRNNNNKHTINRFFENFIPHNFSRHSAKQRRQLISVQFITVYDRGLSFFSLYRASSDTLATFTTLKRTPGMSPTAWPLRPKPATSTSSFS